MITVGLAEPSSGQLSIGSNTTLRLAVSNAGRTPAYDVIVRLRPSAGLLILRGSSEIRVKEVPPGRAVTHECVVRSSRVGQVRLSVTSGSYRIATGQAYTMPTIELTLESIDAGDGRRDAVLAPAPPAQSVQPSHAPLPLFCSYSRADDGLREALERHLASLRRSGLVADWHFRKIEAGSDWEREIDQRLASARIILLLVSPDFMNSDYCYDTEMGRALEMHGAGLARVIPVILRPVRWQDAPFKTLQALPRDGRPVITWPHVDEALLDVVNGIAAAAETLRRGVRPS